MKSDRVRVIRETLFFRQRKPKFPDGGSPRAGRARFSIFAVCLFALAFCVPPAARAQADEQPDIVPPALKKLSTEEKQQLEAEQNVKRRTQLALNLMETRLKTAETLNTENNYVAVLDTLGGFHAVLENALGFLLKNDVENGKVQNNFKKFELALRAQTPRLEIIRREMPSRYGYHVQKLIKAVRAARTKAVEPLFDDSVVPGRKP